VQVALEGSFLQAVQEVDLVSQALALEAEPAMEWSAVFFHPRQNLAHVSNVPKPVWRVLGVTEVTLLPPLGRGLWGR
jgi:hypothetical protein